MKELKNIENELPIETILCIWYNYSGTVIKNLLVGYMLHSPEKKRTVVICHRTGEVLDISYFTHYAEILTPLGYFIWHGKAESI